MKVNGFYVSEWENGTEIISKAVIDLGTKEVVLGDYVVDYDFDELNLEILDREYVIIDGVEYPCCLKDEVEDEEYWYR